MTAPDDSQLPPAEARAEKPLDRLIARVKGILLKPSREWEIIENEKANLQSLFRDFLAPLAAIPAIANFLRMLVSGRFEPFSALTGAVVSYGFSLLGVYAMGHVIYQLADNFGGRQDKMKAMKTAVYASTPVWLAGIVFLVPAFDFFFVFSLYAVFVLYRGLPIMMKAPPDKVTGYEAAVLGVAMVIFMVLIAISAGISHPRPI